MAKQGWGCGLVVEGLPSTNPSTASGERRQTNTSWKIVELAFLFHILFSAYCNFLDRSVLLSQH